MRKFLFYSIIGLIIIGCENYVFFRIPPELKDWGYFKKGSYWVYQNTKTNETDSFYVSSSACYNDTFIADKVHYKITEICNTVLENKTRTIKLNLRIIGDRLELTSFYDNQKIKAITDLMFADNSGNIEQFNVLEDIDSMQINDQMYKEVKHINSSVTNEYHLNTFRMEGVRNDYWISKNQWIIKMVIRLNGATEEWKLINSYILK